MAYESEALFFYIKSHQRTLLPLFVRLNSQDDCRRFSVICLRGRSCYYTIFCQYVFLDIETNVNAAQPVAALFCQLVAAAGEFAVQRKLSHSRLFTSTSCTINYSENLCRNMTIFVTSVLD